MIDFCKRGHIYYHLRAYIVERLTVFKAQNICLKLVSHLLKIIIFLQIVNDPPIVNVQ